MKIVSPQEMARLEKIAYSQGAKEIDFMEAAGLGIAGQVARLIPKEMQIILLCGKGNNAGDTYVVGRHILSMGYEVVSMPLFAL
jgi:NAD(P)H-hydrate epimerase